MGNEEILTVKETAVILRLKPATVYSMSASGELLSYQYRQKGAVRFKKSEVLRFIEDKKRPHILED